MPSPVLSIRQILGHLILTTTLWYGHSCCPHSTNVGSEAAQRGQVSRPSYVEFPLSEWYIRNENLVVSHSCFNPFNDFLFLRKISPELTSMPIFHYFTCGTPTTAWLAKWCHVCTLDLNQRTPGHWSITCELNRCCHEASPCTRILDLWPNSLISLLPKKS